MHDPLRMAVSHALQDLFKIALNQWLGQPLIIAQRMQEFGQICIAVLLDEVDVVILHHSVL